MSEKKHNTVLSKCPDTPSCLNGVAAEHWKTIVPFFVADKVVCKVDIPLLIFACQCWEKSQTAEKDSDRYKAQAQYISIVSKFGATYKSRVQLEMDTKSKPVQKNTAEDDRFMEFI